MTAETPSVCRHGTLRRTCETCDLAEDCNRLERDLTAALARVAELEALLWDACPNPSGINRYNEPAEWWDKRRALLSPSPEPTK